MSKLFIEDTTLTAIGDAIRTKTGTTEPISPLDMPTVIGGITTGGGDGGGNIAAKIVDGTITELTAEDLAGATTIRYYAFRNCNQLISVVLPNGVKGIGEYAFYQLSKLTSVEIPNTVIQIYGNAFYGCTKLASVVFEENGLVNIGGSAFYGCKALTRLEFPNTLVAIGSSAFYGCSSMQEYDFSKHTSIPQLANKNVFTSVPSTCKFILPDALYDEWINATNWSALTVTYVKKSEYDAGGTA